MFSGVLFAAGKKSSEDSDIFPLIYRKMWLLFSMEKCNNVNGVV